jgi:hypothetical protein
LRELWVNNQLVDLYPDENIALTKQVNRLNELRDRQADYSNKFRLPPSPENLRIFGFLNTPSSDSINPYTKLSCTYIENGSELISNGVAIVEQYTGGDIEITAYSGIFDFFNIIGDKSLRDLDFSDCDHVFNLTNVEAGFEEDSNYMYPLIQWGATDKNNDVVDIRYQMPAIPMSFIIEKIFEDTGYTPSGNLLEEDSFTKLYMPIVEDQLFEEDAILESYSFEAHTQSMLQFTYQPVAGGQYNTLNFGYFNSGDAFDSTANWYVAGRYTAQNKVTVNVTSQLMVWIPNVTQSFRVSPGPTLTIPDKSRFFVRLLLNGNSIGASDIIEGQYAGAITFESLNLNLEPGDYLELQLVYISVFQYFVPSPYSFPKLFYVGKTINVYPIQSGEYSFFKVEAINTILLNQTLHFNNLVPDLKQKDVIKDIFYLYGVVPQVDYLTRTFYFRQFKEIAQNKFTDNTLDWSRKLDLKSGINISFRFDEYSQRNNLKWSQDDEPITGNGSINIDDEVLELEGDLFTMTFAASVQEENFKGDNRGIRIKRFTRVEAEAYSHLTDYSEGDYALYNEIVWVALTDTTGTTPGTNPAIWEELDMQYEQTESAQPRLILVRDYDDNGSPPISDLTYTDGTTDVPISNAKIAYFVDSVQPYHLSFEYLKQAHYSELQHVLSKTKIITAKFKLSEADFRNVDFYKPVWVEYFGDHFYINQITNYISGRLTSVELVRM